MQFSVHARRLHVCQPVQVQSQCISMRSLPLLCAKLLGNIRVQELSEISQFFIERPGFSRKGLPYRMIVTTQQIFKITFSVTRIKCIRASQIVCTVLTVHLTYMQKVLKIHAQYWFLLCKNSLNLLISHTNHYALRK